MQYGPTATKALGAAGKASAEFIKAKGLDVANKVLGNPAALAAQAVYDSIRHQYQTRQENSHDSYKKYGS